MKKGVISAILSITATIAIYFYLGNESPLIFISILVLSFLLLYKLADYIADFKITKHYSRIDIVFLIIFCIFLCIPASHISKDKKAKFENRYLAEKAVLIDHKKLNLNYGKDFNAWFNDRFNMRYRMMKWNTIITCNLSEDYCKNGGVTLYKKGNLFYRSSYFGFPKIEGNKQEILDTYAGNVNKLQKYCDDNNIKLYILIVPRKAEFFDYPLADKRNYEPDPAEEIIEYLKTHTKTAIIYPKAEMKIANKETPVYFKTDHHWTKKGAYVGYYELMKAIKKDFPSVQILEESSLEKYYDNRVSEWWNREFNVGQTYKHLGLPKCYAKKILDTPYLYYKNPYRDKLQTDVKLASIPEIGYTSTQDNQFYYPEGLDKKVMVIANSFAANLMEFLPYSFKYTVRYYDNHRYMNLKVYEDAFNKYKPDILVINFHTHYTKGLLNLYPNKYSWEE